MPTSREADNPEGEANAGAIARGDDLARADDWPKALAQWRDALAGPDAANASQRIRWFIRETNDGRDVVNSARPRRRIAFRIFLAVTVVSAIGTAVTLVGIGKSGTESTIIAAAAWSCFAIAIGLSLVFARLLGSQTPQEPVLTAGDNSVSVAMNVAAGLGQPRDLDGQAVHPDPSPVRK